ncbi:Tol-Pal system subunit TolA [Campylobacter pinnipediorum subsp. caledonicus]|uniref:Tol-Pal system subunit TolA n=1 Tax=Campylobacter pinnipediorum subsp. caledonicus TaxID=1874362 RepID=A0A1S6U8H1_9BACT|nr:TonB C-terminal domain-containing protein [Campylobacter pinnipediorum]AQW86399.1 Tol-Pal system subunit TolA [Campylobacter pinnipediorum subsp. caledonicus]AQW88051.1 Tol-Pal system subunit TolA [Campylobacter pinnipediorum subsp. caledonicus]
MLNFKFPTISSFLVSLCLYVSIVAIILINISTFTDPIKKYTDKKDSFMDVMIVEQELSTEIKAPEKKEEKEIAKEDQPEKKQEEKEKTNTTNKQTTQAAQKEEEQVVVSEKKPSLKDLFKDIDTKQLQQKEKKSTKIQSRKKDEKKNSTTKINKATNIIESLKIDEVAKTPESQSTGTYDPLLGAIQNQIERAWRSYKADSDNKALIKILIDAYGNFNYEIIKLSLDDNFNKKVRKFLNKLTTEKFPHSNNNRSISLNLFLEDKL